MNYIEKLLHLYSLNSDELYAIWSKNYLRNQFEALGIRAPIRRKLTKAFIKENGLPTHTELKKVIFFLWDRPEREFQHAALDILEITKKQLVPEDLDWISSLIIKKSWWDTVDTLSPHIIGHMFSNDPSLIPIYADQWIEDENFWLQRAAILYQLKYKQKTDEQRLYRYIERRADSSEFFIQKAIGWALREYAKTSPDSVKHFVANTALKPLSIREALKHLK